MHGHRCDPTKLLLDPYAHAIEGTVHWNDTVLRPGVDSSPYVPRSVVVNPYFDWQGDRPPRTPWRDTLIYELHVRGFSKLHSKVPERLRGTYAALGHPAVIGHLLELGVTAVELLPVHQFVTEYTTATRGQHNYWGYSSIGYFAPYNGYASPGAGAERSVREFQQMVMALHRAGIEVILDVVFNHTGEGAEDGGTLCYRGIDNASYYRLHPVDPSRYVDYSGCGNSLNLQNSHVLGMIMDSLRYWVEVMHVDGFRFDLASALARSSRAFDLHSSFFHLIHQDPVLQEVKLIAEPWDLGEGGYQVGRFPARWSEWNGKYRDSVRDYWRGSEHALPEFASRFAGSADLYESRARSTFSSVNFVCCHDGFTLRDLVTYNNKHNYANGEGNRDGESHNRSWNSGREGDTDELAVLSLRRRQVRNFLATLFLSQGVPMLLAGDELGRSQRGNNNSYCQDNDISWLDWSSLDSNLLDFVRKLSEFRRSHAVLRRSKWFEGRTSSGYDVGWFRVDGLAMQPDDWHTPSNKAVGVLLRGEPLEPLDQWLDESPAGADHFYIVFNAHHAQLSFTLPEALPHLQWFIVVDTAAGEVDDGADSRRLDGVSLTVLAHAMIVLRGFTV